jgi:NADH-quinone oxidoreductase subunit G
MYAGLTLEELGGGGVRWPQREQAGALPAPSAVKPAAPRKPRALAKARGGKLISGSYRSIWAGPEVAASPALAFLHPHQRVEISPADARRLGLADGVEMAVADATGTQIRARVTVRDAIPAGSAFLQRAIATDSAERLRGETIEIVAIADPPAAPPDADPAVAADSDSVAEAVA